MGEESSLEFILENHSPREIHRKNNINYCICLIRKKMIQLTPEEKVRQGLLSFFLKELKIPREQIEVEYPLARIEKGAKGRVDIIVFDKEGYTLLIAECKAENIALDKRTVDQLMKYDNFFGSDYLLLTNGIETYSTVYDYEEKKHDMLNKIPTFAEMINNEYEILEYKESEFIRLTEAEISTPEYVYQNYRDIIGEDTLETYHEPILRFWEALQDEKIKLDFAETRKLKIIEDLGIVPIGFGNAAGGNWSGNYRGFLVEDFDKNRFTVYLTILASGKTINDPRYGNRRGESILIVAIDNGIKSHNSLQLCLNSKYLRRTGNKFLLTHRGDATNGKKGRIPRKIILSKIKEEILEIYSDEEIILGEFEAKKDLNMIDLKGIICNLLDYAIVRDEIRELN